MTGHNADRDDGAGCEERQREREHGCGKRVGRFWCLRDKGHAGDCAGPPELAAEFAEHIADSYRPDGVP